jgi:AraC-like DNA-binding protein
MKIAPARQSLTQTHAALPPFRERVRAIGEPEHFFVGLSDVQMPHPHNILMFCKNSLDVSATSATHHRFMLIFNLETKAELLLDNRRLALSPGQALLVFPFQTHQYCVRPGNQVTWLFVTFELQSTDPLNRLRNLPIEVPPDLQPFLDALLREYTLTHKAMSPADEVTALLSYLLRRLLRQVRPASPAVWEPHPALSPHRLVQRACHLVATHLEKPLTVAGMARDLSVSAGYLRNCFRQVANLKVTEYIRRSRVFAACALLSRTELNITEIAEQCGFSSIYAFSRAFTREVGQSPTNYRAHLWEQHNMGPIRAKAVRGKTGAAQE